MFGANGASSFRYSRFMISTSCNPSLPLKSISWKYIKSILVHRLEDIGIRSIHLDLFKDYHKDHKLKVTIGEYLSDESDITFGVPQGSVLGPTLILIYNNNLTNMYINEGNIISYADDTAVIFTGDSWNSVRRSAEGLARIAKWLNTNLLTLNTLSI